jgi:hypothetical protein
MNDAVDLLEPEVEPVPGAIALVVAHLTGTPPAVPDVQGLPCLTHRTKSPADDEPAPEISGDHLRELRELRTRIERRPAGLAFNRYRGI